MVIKVNMNIHLTPKKLLLWLSFSLTLGCLLGAVTVAASLFWYYQQHHQNQPFTPKHKIRHQFRRMDHDPKDGVVNVSEFQQFINHVIKRIDDNQDGKIDISEVPRFMRRTQQPLWQQIQQQGFVDLAQLRSYFEQQFRQADGDQNQQLTLDEFTWWEKYRVFQRFDANKDRSISLPEFMQANPQQKPTKKLR